MPWLLQIQSHSWDCGHIPEKLIAFSLDICQKWVWQAVGLFYVHLLRTSILFSNIAVPFTLPPTVHLRFRVFCTMPVCLLILGRRGVDNREPSTGQAARELQLHLLEDKPPGSRSLCITALWFSEPSSPTSQDFMTLLRLGPEIPTEQDHLINKHSAIVTLVLLISQQASNKLTNFHGVQQCS